MVLRRWTFHDPDGVLDDWTFASNPSAMQEPEIGDQVQANSGLTALIGGSVLTVTLSNPQVPQVAVPWQFEGAIYTLADHDKFELWMTNGRPVEVTDHFGQTWLVYIENVDIIRAGTRRRPQRHKYTAHAQVLERVT